MLELNTLGLEFFRKIVWDFFIKRLVCVPYKFGLTLILIQNLISELLFVFRTYILRLQSGYVKGTLPIIEAKETGPCPLGLPSSNNKEVIAISDDEDDETNEQPHTAEWRVVISSKNYKC